MTASIEKAQQRVKDLEEQLKQAKALKLKVEARARSAENKRRKADDDRRKILIGAAILSKVDHEEWPREKMLAMMDKFLTRPAERQLFGLTEVAEAPAKK